MSAINQRLTCFFRPSRGQKPRRSDFYDAKLFIFLFLFNIFIGGLGIAQEPIISEHPKKLYRDSSGVLFAPKQLPLRFYVSLSSYADHAELLFENFPEDSEFLLKEGINEICIPTTLSNKDGEKTKETCFEIVADGTSPNSNIELKSDGFYKEGENEFHGKNLNVLLTSEDALAGLTDIFVSVNRKAFQSVKEIEWNFDDSEYTLLFYAIDNVGNVEKVQKRLFYSDITPPGTQKKVSGEIHGNIFPSGTMIELISEDNASGVKAVYYKIDNTQKTKYTKPFSLTGLDNREHELTWYAEDNVGNMETQNSFVFYFDTIPPETEINITGTQHKEKTTVFVSGKPTITLTARDNKADIKKIIYKINPEDEQEYSQAFNLPEKSGLHRVKYFAIDNVGNKSEEKTRNIYLDLTAPETFYKFSRSSFWDKDTVIFSIGTHISLFSTDMESGVQNLNMKLNGVEKPYSEPVEFSEEGLFQLSYFAIDKVKNMEAAKQIWIRVDGSVKQLSTGPERHHTTWAEIQKTGLTGAIDLPFYIRISESADPDAESFLLNFDDLRNGETAKELSFNNHGENHIRLNIGNKKLKIPLTIDGEAPKTAISYSGANNFEENHTKWFGSGLQIEINSLESNDAFNTGVENIYFSVNGSEFGMYREPLNIFDMEQEYNLRYYAVDSVKNMEKINEVNFIVDITPPSTFPEFEKGVFGNFISAKSVVKLNATDNLSGVKNIFFYFDGYDKKKFLGQIPLLTLKELPEGEHILQYYSVDNVANLETTREFNVFIDHTPPEVSMDIIGSHYKKDNTYFIRPTNKILLSALDEITEVKSLTYRVAGGALTPYENGVKIPDKSGYFNLTYLSSDAVDNVVQKTEKFCIDEDPPISSISFRGPKFNDIDYEYISAETKVIVSSQDNSSGLKNMLVGTSSNNLSYYREPFQIQGTGERTITYYGIDNVNNREKAKVKTVFVDNTNPSVKIVFNAAEDNLKENVTHIITPYTFIHIIAGDNVGLEGVFYTIDDKDEMVYRKPISNFTRGEEFKLKVTAVDRVGNKTVKTMMFKVE